jgi:hypothetical protein
VSHDFVTVRSFLLVFLLHLTYWLDSSVPPTDCTPSYFVFFSLTKVPHVSLLFYLFWNHDVCFGSVHIYIPPLSHRSPILSCCCALQEIPRSHDSPLPHSILPFPSDFDHWCGWDTDFSFDLLHLIFPLIFPSSQARSRCGSSCPFPSFFDLPKRSTDLLCYLFSHRFRLIVFPDFIFLCFHCTVESHSKYWVDSSPFCSVYLISLYRFASVMLVFHAWI